MDRRGSSLDDADGGSAGASVPMTAERAWALLPAVMDAIAGDTGWWRCSEPEVAERVVLVTQVENQAAAAQVVGLGEAASRCMPARGGHRGTAAWLRGLVPITPRVARQRALLSEQLPTVELTETREAFTAGAISAGHAATIARTVTAFDAIPDLDATTRAEAQQLLLAEAHRLDVDQLGRAANHLRNRLDPGAAERLARDEELQHQQRSVTLVQESSGMWFLSGSLAKVDGAMLATALDPLAAPRPASDGTPDIRSRSQRMADALTGLAELSLAQRAGQPHGLPSRHGAPVRVIVTADLQTLTADPTRKGGQAGAPAGRLDIGEPGGVDLSPLQVQMMACDGEISPVVLDGDGRPLDVGESMYRFPPRIRRAIEIRDQHCSFPSCQAPPPWCHTHHLVAFGRNGESGGPTSEANGTLLCGRHHRHVHATGWVGRLVDGHVRWQPPRRDAPAEPPTDYVRQFETALRQLASRWLARNPQLRDTG